MNKLFMILGLFLSTQLFAGNACPVQGLIEKGSSHKAYLYAYTLDGNSTLEAATSPATYDFYVPYFNIGEANRIFQIDDVTFQVETKGVFLASITIGMDAAGAVFALEVTDSTGSYLIDGSDLPFNDEDEVEDPYKTLTFLFELQEKHSWIRVANTLNNNVDLEANQETGVAAGLTIVQIK